MMSYVPVRPVSSTICLSRYLSIRSLRNSCTLTLERWRRQSGFDGGGLQQWSLGWLSRCQLQLFACNAQAEDNVF